jgi:tRNA-splicing ligase RtcB
MSRENTTAGVEIKLRRVAEWLWEIPRQGGMRVPGRIYASEELLPSLEDNNSLRQVMNVACLPGIVGYSLAMPDIHWGYGFPIGGVAAMDYNNGVIPSGVGAHGAIPKISQGDERRLLREGARWAVGEGYGRQEDLEYMEEGGALQGADADLLSERALERGLRQVGTLGSGNHFLEIGRVEEIYRTREAEILGLFPDQLLVLIHTGSRGLGYQTCEDFLKVMNRATGKYRIDIPDRQLACTPLKSPEGKDYLAAMACAANYAWANRQVIMSQAEKAFIRVLGVSPRELGFFLIYDVCHNIAKIEEHVVEGKPRRVCVHRKGATRAFPPDHPLIPEAYRQIGQPVLVPGDMGRYSFLLVGTETAMEATFGSTCHGAGRVMSRAQSRKISRGINIDQEMARRGVVARYQGRATMAEEMPHSYKDVAAVVETMERAGISKKVARFRPVGIIKG